MIDSVMYFPCTKSNVLSFRYPLLRKEINTYPWLLNFVEPAGRKSLSCSWKALLVEGMASAW
jgi:hypothetical protein